MAGDVRASLLKELHSIPPGWNWEWFTDVMDVDGGTQPPASTFVDSPLAGYVRLVQIRDFETDAHITYIPDSKKWRKCEVQDVLIGRYGAALGRICRGLSGAYNVALAKVVISDRIDLDFAYQLLRSNYFQVPLLAGGARSAQAGFNKSNLAVIPLPIPPLTEQKAIAAVLGALDDKIELNRRMNATLEAMARALFQSWFVDFDPVRAKLDGRQPPNLDPATAALFPNAFQESSLGSIPYGWRVVYLEDIATVSSGKRPEGRCDVLSPECNVPLYGGGGRMGYVPSALHSNPILFTGRVGTLGLIFRTAEPSWPSDNTLIVEPQPGFFDYTYFALKGFDLIRLNRGSTQPLLTQTDLKRQEVILATEDVIKAFTAVSAPIFQQIVSNTQENRILTAMRDMLLPKLLSGELSIEIS